MDENAPASLNVLFIDDSSDDVFLILEELNTGFSDISYLHVDDAEGLVDALQRQAWDIIITDYYMPGFSAEEALEIYHQQALDVPVILMSGAVGEEAAVAIMKAGIHDFVMKDKMARLVPVVMRELEDARMRQAKRAAEQASIAKSLFLANMSHEIRTPMSGVIGLAALLADTTLSSEQREFVTAIQASGEALLGIVNDILDISKIEAGKLELDPQTFDLREVITETIDILNIKALNKEVPLFYRIADNIPARLVGDPIRIRQIIMNLMSNAIKFTSEGYVFLEVVAEIIDEGQIALNFSVADTGIGIPEHKHEAVFDEYTQADKTTTRDYGGTGLGLSICRRLAQLMEGEVSLISKEGEGTTFNFSVDLRIDLPVRDAETPSYPQVNVLLINHQSPSSCILERYLRQRRASIDVVNSMEELRERFVANEAMERYQLVCFEDLSLAEPVMSLLKCFEHAENTKVMYVAPYADRGDISHCERQALDGYLSHPLHESAMDTVLSGLFDDSPISEYKLVTRFNQSRNENASALLHGSNLKVLLVEDNPVNQKVAIHMLKKAGCDVACVSDGAAAVAAYETEEFDVIFMDCEMPVMNGYQATAHIRQQDKLKGVYTPVFALTASVLDSDRKRCLDAGMDGFILKPIDREVLQNILDTLSNDQAKTIGLVS